MAVAVIGRPLGHKLNTNAISGVASDGSGNTFIHTESAHGLTTGQYVYIDSNIESYNGFKYVEYYNSLEFFIRYSEFSDYVQFKQQADVFYYVSDLDHGWQCVHLPIVYELESDIYPVNSVDPEVNFLVSFEKDGYLQIGHDALSGGDALQVLDYVKISNGGPTIYAQVIEVTSTILTVVNLPYFVATQTKVQKARNNYHIDVRVYAGLPAGHYWESEKPYELATTLRFIPDSNNQIKFSIAEILKGYIKTRNNLTLDTLPNNLDFFTAFYIEYAEGYDVSDGTEITAFTDEFTDDSEEFEGYAVNAMLPFKNLYSGFMSEYLLSDTVPKALFLTNFAVPSLYENYFFDISVLVKEGLPQLFLKKVWYFDDGTISHTEEDEISDFDEGVYRLQLEAQCSETQEIITTYIDSEWESNVEGWYQGPGIFTDNWDWGNSPDYFSDGSGYVFKNHEVSEFPSFRHAISINGGQLIRLRFQFGAVDDLTSYTIEVVAIDQSTGDQYQIVAPYAFFKDSGAGDDFLTIDEDITMPTDILPLNFTQIGFIIGSGFGSGNVVFMNYFRITSTEEVTRAINKVIISITDGGGTSYSEEKTLNVICECDDTFVNDELRLLEGSGVRQLE